MDIPQDILDQLRIDFGIEAVPGLIEKLVAATGNARVQRCIVFKARGHRWFFDYLCRMTKLDFRDVIMTAEYGNGDPQLRLYDFSKPIPLAKIENPFPVQDFQSARVQDDGKAI